MPFSTHGDRCMKAVPSSSKGAAATSCSAAMLRDSRYQPARPSSAAGAWVRLIDRNTAMQVHTSSSRHKPAPQSRVPATPAVPNSGSIAQSASNPAAAACPSRRPPSHTLRGIGNASNQSRVLSPASRT